MKRTWSEVEKQGAVYDKAKDYKLPNKAKPALESKENKIVIKNPKTDKKVAMDIDGTRRTKVENH